MSFGSRSRHGPFTAWFLTHFLLPIALLMPGACLQAAWTPRTTDLVLVVDEGGSVTPLTEVSTGANHVAAGQPAALLSIQVAGQWWTPEQAGEKQPLQWVLEVLGEQGTVEGATLEFDKYLTAELPVAVAAGQTLVCDGTGTLRLYDAQGKQVKKHTLPGEPPQVANGTHEVMFSGEFQGDPTPTVRVQFQWLGSATVVE